jgi:hypothetical protein
MKTSPARFIPFAVLTAGLATALLNGCSKSDQTDAKDTMKDAYADTKASMSKAWDSIKDYSFDKKSDFTAGAKAMSSKMDANLSEMRANYSDAKASASRQAAMAELKDSEADYKQKLDALGNASSATWDSAKNNVKLSWDRLEASYYKARAN